jgi:hypothetical protein
MPTYWQDRTVPSVILPLKKKRIFLGRSLNFRFLMRNKARSIPEISLLRGVFLELAFSLGQDLVTTKNGTFLRSCKVLTGSKAVDPLALGMWLG